MGSNMGMGSNAGNMGGGPMGQTSMSSANMNTGPMGSSMSTSMSMSDMSRGPMGDMGSRGPSMSDMGSRGPSMADMGSRGGASGYSTTAVSGGPSGGSGGYGSSMSRPSAMPDIKHEMSASRPFDTIIIRNLPLDCNWQVLREGFTHCGDIKYAEMKERGCGLIRFGNERDAERAISMMHKQTVAGRVIDVRPY